MDNSLKYQQIILQYLEGYLKNRQAADPDNGVETQLIVDKERHHYQLLRVGWQDRKFSYLCLFHLDIKNGKIWIQRNNTEELVAEELVSLGVPSNDIILGFKPETLRAYSGFGVT